MNSLQRAFCALIPMFSASLFAAEPDLYWNFDTGENINTEAGTTEFGRGEKLQFKGLGSVGKRKDLLSADPAVRSTHLFADSIRKKALRTGRDEASGTVNAIHGKLSKPISAEQGSICMWVKPENWNGLQKGPFRIFFAADDGNPRSDNELLFYKNGSNNNLLFLIGPNRPKEWSVVQASIWKWQPNEWHFIAASWTKDTLNLYIDGKLTQQKRKPFLPAKPYQRIHIGGDNWKTESGITWIDDVMIFDKALTKADFDRLYVQTQPTKKDRPAPIEHRLGLSKPAQDGKINDFEYGFVTNGTFNISSGELSKDTFWAVARDQEKLYIACLSRKPEHAAAIKNRDGNIWEDESIELHLEQDGNKWQFVINSAGFFYDAKNGKAGWNVAKFIQKHAISGDRWIFEGALSFQDIGIEIKEDSRLYMTMGRSGGRGAGYTAMTPLFKRFADTNNFLKLIMDRSAPPVVLDYKKLPGNSGDLELTLKLPAQYRGELHLKGIDVNSRINAEKKIAGKTLNGQNTAIFFSDRLAQEGTLVYTVSANSKKVTGAKLKYISPEKVKVRYLLVHQKDQRLETGLALTPPLSASMMIIQELKDKSGKVIFQKSEPVGAQNIAKFKHSLFWDLKKLAPGSYDYYLSIEENGKRSTVHHQYFLKPSASMPWDDFKAGISEDVPSPWSSPAAEQAKLNCKYQQYDFTGTLFPRQISAKGTELLAAPIQLKINGKLHTVPAKFQVVKKTAQAVFFKSSGSADRYLFEIEGSVEYDGFLNMKFSYAPKSDSGSELNDLALIIPMKPEYSKLVTYFKPGDTRAYSGKLVKPFIKDLISHPVFWFGDAEYGLYWGADNLRGTRIYDPANSLVITPAKNGKGAVAAIKIVDRKFLLKGKRTFEFSFQGTPVKDVNRKLSKPYMFQGGVTLGVTPYFNIFNYNNKEYMDTLRLKQQSKNGRKKSPIYAFYSCIYGVAPFAPEWPWYQERWISSPPYAGAYKQDWPTKNELQRNRGLWAFGCVNDRNFMNWQLYYLASVYNDPEFGMRDLYFDMAYPRACDNPLHGCRWVDDFGRVRTTYPIKANREFTKRIRRIMTEKDPASVLMYHPSGEPLPPMYGLVDFMVDGEIWVSKVSEEESYYNIFTPDLFQSSYMGIKIGTNSIYLNQLDRAAQIFNPARTAYWRREQKAPEAVRAVRHYLGYLLLHDTRPQAGAAIVKEGRILEKQLYSLGYGEGNFTFQGYWRKDCPVKTNAPVMVSTYTFPGRILAVVVNDDLKKSVKAALTVPAGFKGKIYDLETGKTFPSPEADVPAKGFRLIVFEEK